MNKKDAIKQADKLIKEEKYKEAWQLLRPYADDAQARKRLQYIKAKAKEVKAKRALEEDVSVDKKSGGIFGGLLNGFGAGGDDGE